MENDGRESNLEELEKDGQDIENQAEEVSYEQRRLNEAVMEELKASQSFWGAVLGGILGAVAGAVAWVIIAAVTNYKVGYVALGIGFLTGFLVKKIGHGFEKRYAYVGALCAFLGCFVGNICSDMFIVSRQYHIPFMELVSIMNMDLITAFIKDSFQPMDFLFYAIAVYEGYRFSLMTRDELISRANTISGSMTYKV